jgi:hypothetical protein
VISERVDSLKESSRCLLAAVRSGGQDQLLPDLLRRRQEAIDALTVAVGRGAALSTEEIQEIHHLDAELMAAAAHRRDQIGGELAALQRGRHAGLAYQNRSNGGPRFVDRSS